MSDKKINLEEILNKCSIIYGEVTNNPRAIVTAAEAMNAMKEACRQVLELAAENAITMDDPNSYCGNTGSEYPPDTIVNKQSIIDTIKQVE